MMNYIRDYAVWNSAPRARTLVVSVRRSVSQPRVAPLLAPRFCIALGGALRRTGAETEPRAGGGRCAGSAAGGRALRLLARASGFRTGLFQGRKPEDRVHAVCELAPGLRAAGEKRAPPVAHLFR